MPAYYTLAQIIDLIKCLPMGSQVTIHVDEEGQHFISNYSIK